MMIIIVWMMNRDLPESGYIDYTQCPNLAKTFKKRGDDIHEQYLKVGIIWFLRFHGISQNIS